MDNYVGVSLILKFLADSLCMSISSILPHFWLMYSGGTTHNFCWSEVCLTVVSVYISEYEINLPISVAKAVMDASAVYIGLGLMLNSKSVKGDHRTGRLTQYCNFLCWCTSSTIYNCTDRLKTFQCIEFSGQVQMLLVVLGILYSTLAILKDSVLIIDKSFAWWICATHCPIPSPTF